MVELPQKRPARRSRRWIRVTAGIFVCLLAVILYFRFPIQWSKTIVGTVTIEGSGEPVEGAVVFLVWKASYGWSGTVCEHIESTVTDAQGQYRIPAWIKLAPYPGSSRRVQIPIAYKAGFRYTGAYDNDVYVVPFVGTASQRVEYLAQLAGNASCSPRSQRMRQALPPLKAMLAEAESLASTSEDQVSVYVIRYDIDFIEIGGEEMMRQFLRDHPPGT